MLKLIDSHNYCRIKLETNVTGFALREIVESTRIGPLNIFIWDGFNSNARRREIYPEYKMRRTAPGENIYASFKLLKKALAHTRAMQIQIDGWEADDVIAKLVRSTTDECEIHSTDMDFLSLTAEFPKRVFCGCNPKIPPEWVTLYKITVGDPSDNIPGIKGFGKLAWERNDKVVLQKVVDGLEDPDVLDASKGSKSWIRENLGLLANYRQIVEFMDVPDYLIQRHLTTGDRDYNKASAVLKEFLQ